MRLLPPPTGEITAYEGDSLPAPAASSRPSRYVRPLAPPPLALQPRDRAALAAVFKHRYLTAEHVRELLFPGTSVRRLQRRLRALWAHQLLDRHYLPFVLSGGKPPPWAGRPLYTLARRGAEVVAEELDIDLAHIPSTPGQNARGYATLLHHLVVIDFMVALESACRRRGDVVLTSAEHEAELREVAGRWLRQGREREFPLIPDGAATIRLPAETLPATFYVEVIRAGVRGGNETLRTRLRRYAEANHAGLFRRLYGHAHVRAVLLATTSPARAEHLRALAADLPHGRRLFWFGTYEERDDLGRLRSSFTPESILAQRWQTADGQLVSLVPPGPAVPAAPGNS